MCRRLLLPLCLLSLISFNSACKQQRSIRIVTASPVASIDPQTTEDPVTLSVLSNVYESLVQFSDDQFSDELKIIPHLAVSSSNPNDLTWIFSLRKGIRFHNGKAFDAYDVKYSIERGMSEPHSALGQWLGSIRAVAVPNSSTVAITTSRKSPLLLAWLTSVYMIPKDSAQTIATNANGTGPYRVSEFTPGKLLALIRSDNYWNGEPRWDFARFTANPDSTARVQLVNQAEADLAAINEPSAKNAPSSIKVLEYPAALLAVLGFSLKSGKNNIFVEDSIRKAIALAIDQSKRSDPRSASWTRPAGNAALAGSGIRFVELCRLLRSAIKWIIGRKQYRNGFGQTL